MILANIGSVRKYAETNITRNTVGDQQCKWPRPKMTEGKVASDRAIELCDEEPSQNERKNGKETPPRREIGQLCNFNGTVTTTTTTSAGKNIRGINTPAKTKKIYCLKITSITKQFSPTK